jgi:hypothetical protein
LTIAIWSARAIRRMPVLRVGRRGGLEHQHGSAIVVPRIALMPRHSPCLIELSDDERGVLESMARSYTLPYWQVVRAQMVLLAAQGLRNDQIAARCNCRREVVSQWRKRFFETRLSGLEDLPRRGRSPTFPPSRPR